VSPSRPCRLQVATHLDSLPVFATAASLFRRFVFNRSSSWSKYECLLAERSLPLDRSLRMYSRRLLPRGAVPWLDRGASRTIDQARPARITGFTMPTIARPSPFFERRKVVTPPSVLTVPGALTDRYAVPGWTSSRSRRSGPEERVHRLPPSLRSVRLGQEGLVSQILLRWSRNPVVTAQKRGAHTRGGSSLARKVGS